MATAATSSASASKMTTSTAAPAPSTTIDILRTLRADYNSISSSRFLSDYKPEFISFCLEQQVLRFGSFTLKSGRVSPYFFNAGKFSSGLVVRKLGEFYAKALLNSALEFDHLFGPAYKGIPLVTTTSIALSTEEACGRHERNAEDIPPLDIDFTFNRKVEKDHGEGGNLVGADLKNKQVVIVDDVITAGTASMSGGHIATKRDLVPLNDLVRIHC
mmetsp:Transcript_16182/g.39964  ORF Transcript_16182/g.39964 Transcript_16182/m.39964 type:complete len:216 (-) Transcript_16182:666-1313(-)|eukprot:g19813.t1